MLTSPPVVLCFSGSDPSAGAGVQADLLAIHSLKAHCAGVITALTIQNTVNVHSFISTPAEIVLEQANTLVADMSIRAIKMGMLGNVEIIKALGQWLKDYSTIPIVLDPVTVASGGGALAQQHVIEAMIEYLFPVATIVTPNSIEAKQLVPHAESWDHSAKTLLSYGCEYVLLKGTHVPTPDVRNVLYNKAGLVQEYIWPRLPHEYHGSGCTLAASIAALLAQQNTMEQAVQHAQAYTWECLNHAYKPGKGQYVPNRNYQE